MEQLWSNGATVEQWSNGGAMEQQWSNGATVEQWSNGGAMEQLWKKLTHFEVNGVPVNFFVEAYPGLLGCHCT